MSDTSGGSGGEFDIVGHVRIDSSDLDVLAGKAEKSTKSAKRDFDELGKTLRTTGRDMSLMVSAPIIAGLAYAGKAASNLGESVNVTNITFKEAKKSVEDFVREAYKIGFSERAAREATASFGGLLQNLGSTREESAALSIDLTKLASDLGSAFNKNPEEAAHALSAALRGEQESIRAYNVSINDTEVRQKAVALGLATSTTEVDKHAKAQATLALIMEQTKNVQGDFANTQDGVANSTRVTKAEVENLAAKMGTELLPLAKTMIQDFRGVVHVFSEMGESQQIVVLGMLAFAASLGPILTLGGNVVRVVNLMSTAFSKMGVTGSLAAGGMSAAFVISAAILLENAANADKFVASLKNLDGNNIQGLTKDYTALAEKSSELRSEFLGLGAGLNALTLYRLNEEAKEAGERFETLSSAFAMVEAATGLTDVEVQKLADSMELDLTKGAESVAIAIATQAEALRTGTVASEGLATATDTLSDKTATATEKQKAFKDAVDATLGIVLTSQEGEVRLAELTDKLGEKYKEAAGKADLHTEAGRALRTALFDMENQLIKQADALAAEGVIEDTAAAKKQYIIDKLKEQQRLYPELRVMIQQHIDKLNEIKPEYKSVVTVDATQAKLTMAEVVKARNEMADPSKWHVKVEVDGSRTYVPNVGQYSDSPPLTNRAIGGGVSHGMSYVVNELGREVFVAPTDGTVLSANDVQKLTSGGGGAKTSVTIGDINISGVKNAADVEAVLPDLTAAIIAGVGNR